MSFKKTFNFCLLFLSFSLLSFAQSTEEPTGLPGDGFSLEGALQLFKTADSPEDFEKKLNSEANFVNNLDLNEDGEIDFIRVEDIQEGEVHAFVLQVPLNKTTVQDIAVIELEKTGKEEAVLQILGDEDLYGETVIVEALEMQSKSIGKGPNADLEFARIIVNVWAWPSVRYVYRPSYRVYVSPWRFGHYPVKWWRPWRPRTFATCHSYRSRNYRPHFHVVTTHRVVRAHKVYAPRRKSTTVVRSRTTTVVAANKRSGKVVKGNRVVASSSSSRTVAKTTNGKAVKKTTGTKVAKGNKTTAVKRSTTTKVAKGKGGKVAAKKTTTKKKATANGRTTGQRKSKKTGSKARVRKQG